MATLVSSIPLSITGIWMAVTGTPCPLGRAPAQRQAGRLQRHLQPLRQPQLSLSAVLGKDSQELQAMRPRDTGLTGLWKYVCYPERIHARFPSLRGRQYLLPGWYILDQ